MDHLSDQALHDVLNRDPEQGWRVFVDAYTPTMLALIERAGVADPDHRADVYVRVCEHLAGNRCARLRRHDPGKGALAAWLTIVVRRCVVDWVRSRAGRRRLFGAVQRLDAAARRVFELFYWEERPPAAIAEEVAHERPGFTIADVFDALAAVEACLTDRHRAELLATIARARTAVSLDDEAADPALRLVDAAPDPEAALRLRRAEAALAAALDELPAEDAAIVRMLFVNGWSRELVRRALHLPDLPRERVRQILAGLRARLDASVAEADLGTLGKVTFLED
jgi:DNA-directed RNA polymerase specialized sigma24 family protein